MRRKFFKNPNVCIQAYFTHLLPVCPVSFPQRSPSSSERLIIIHYHCIICNPFLKFSFRGCILLHFVVYLFPWQTATFSIWHFIRHLRNAKQPEYSGSVSVQSLLRQAFRQAQDPRSHSGKNPSCLLWSCFHGTEGFSRKYCQNIQ